MKTLDSTYSSAETLRRGETRRQVAGLVFFCVMVALIVLASPFIQERLFPSKPARPDWTPEQKQSYLDSLSQEPTFFRVVEKGQLDGNKYTLLKFDGGDRLFIYKESGHAPTVTALPPPSAAHIP